MGSSEVVGQEGWPGPEGLVGRWSMVRRITGEPDGRVRGTATFQLRAEGTLGYLEAGRLATSTGSFDVTRRFLFRATPDGLRIDFDDGPNRGGLFVDLHVMPAPGGAWVAGALHPCGPDRYDVRYRFALPQTWCSEIVVAGPRKRYRAVTHYRRLVAATPLSKLQGLA